jgi:glycosyltransferase involved in cell wall biosynthesis
VFGVTGNRHIPEQVKAIAHVVKQAREAVGSIRLIAFGRGAKEAESELRRALDGSGVDVTVLGILPPEEVSEILAKAHVHLFVRGGISSRRGTAISGIIHGLPIVGYTSEETGFPITEAGVRLVPVGDADGLARELITVLKDKTMWWMLSERSRKAARRYFSWDAIAERFLKVLRNEGR